MNEKEFSDAMDVVEKMDIGTKVQIDKYTVEKRGTDYFAVSYDGETFVMSLYGVALTFPVRIERRYTTHAS